MNNNVKKSLISFTAAAAMAVTGLGLSNASSAKAATTVQNAPSVVRTKNNSALFSTPSSDSKISNRILGTNTSWRVAKAVVDDNGTTWYLVGNNEWLSGADVTTASQATTEAAATTTTTSTTQATAANVISTAKKYLGTPYVWGGKTPSGFDCSGFTSYVYNEATGKNIGSYTVAQESAGTQEAVSQASAGDLLFWGGKGSSYHVAIYLGNNQYIAAPQPGESVKISSISSYFMPSFAVKVL
ncbi:NLP P60 protein [Companilactobacillus paralimentarius DSM 13238 = JCM 10415]|uniref:NLP P60 protein n=1 Tax=Companilactobacillus paralimentarius DSM 13238 = JCM 10415 TaxID=1122151 RepID=A0A0R1PQ83_9LACO|nr:C40 family peptidase [Companilactobacillus paralimentarius]KAE9564496.1 glycoside hydrolase [Companilactobacillus paralimentarius]KRL32005.1 NLP P60 protein [Companilactobacillus paralimentarius DSM 13238 = JCM 10415]MDR4932734.1 C40 family peptidase [Companilactobacillus paralimentarius]